MKSKMNKHVVQNNTEIWKTNLSSKIRRRQQIPNMPNDLSEMCRMPRKMDVLGRFQHLFHNLKEKNRRIDIIALELCDLWIKLNFPMISRQQVTCKITNLVNQYVNYRKRKSSSFTNDMYIIFDITKENGLWLSSEDKHLYILQTSSNGSVGYTTEKVAPQKSIHPSKRLSIKEDNNNVIIRQPNSESDDHDTSDDLSPQLEGSTRKAAYQKTKSSVNLVNRYGISTRQASRISHTLVADGHISVPTPSQSGIWRGVISKGKTSIIKMQDIIQRERNFCMHFDGKIIQGQHYHVICLTSPNITLNLGVVLSQSGRAEDIYNEIKNVIDNYNSWRSIKMIVCDTTPVNSGPKNGIVARLQREFQVKDLGSPQYIGCQHHILDLIIRHVLDFCFPHTSTNPNIDYVFVQSILNEYESLQKNYIGKVKIPCVDNPGWRDDFRFLFELCEAYKFYMRFKKFPEIKWRKLPTLNNARWNSRATFTLITYFLLPKYRAQISNICDFISTTWASAWFSNQHYCSNIYQELDSGISVLSCPNALKSFRKHWVKEMSAVDVPRTNIVAERAVKLLEQIYQTCKSNKYVNVKFVNSNFLD